MNNRINVDIFAEDRAHEELLSPLVARVGKEEGARVRVRVLSARGGHGRAIAEFKLYQSVVEKHTADAALPDLVVVAIDGNCTSFAAKRNEIQQATNQLFTNRLIAACPDPHIERWYLADPESFHSVVGHQPVIGRKKCVRNYYKNLLSNAVKAAGHPATLRGIEFASELVTEMDLYRAGQGDRSFRAFVDDLRGQLRRAIHEQEN